MKRVSISTTMVVALIFLLPIGPIWMDSGQEKAHAERAASIETPDQWPVVQATAALPSSDPGGWRARLAQNAHIRYRDVFPGIDLAYAGTPEKLDALLIVNPGADPAAIHLDFLQAETLTLDAQGRIWVQTSDATIGLLRPRLSQQVRSHEPRTTNHESRITGAFLRLDAQHVGIRVGDYDVTQPLMIRFEVVFFPDETDNLLGENILFRRAKFESWLTDPLAVPAQAPMITATKTAMLANDVDMDGMVDPGDTLMYTITITNTGGTTATGVMFTDTIDANTTLVGGSVNTSPLGLNDGYTASGNIPISLNAMNGVLANDVDPDTGNNMGLTVTQVQGSAMNVGMSTATTASGIGGITGSVTLNANGSFDYEPPPGFSGMDTFTYQVSDAGGKTDTATVTITISQMVWFISNSAGGSNRGTFSNPFTSLASFNAVNTGAAPNPQNGHFIALRRGTGTYSEADGINLRDNQMLIGEAVQFNTVFMAAANSSAAYQTFANGTMVAPTITTTMGHGVDLASSNTVRGLNVGNTTGFFGFNGGAVGSPTINTVNVTGTGGGINISTSGAFGMSVTFDTLESVNSSAQGINLVGVTGTLGVTSGGTNGISNPTGTAVDINGGSVSMTYPGPITKNNAGRLIEIQNKTGGTVDFSGTLMQNNASGTGIRIAGNSGGTTTFSGSSKTLNTSGNTAVTLSSNGGTTINFTGGGLDIDTTNGMGFSAMGGGTINVGGSGNSITTTTAKALDLDAVTTGMTFSSISSTNSSAEGIEIDNVSGSFTVTGATTVNNPTLAGIDIASSGGSFSFGALNITTTNKTGLFANNGGTVNTTSGAISTGTASGVDINDTALGIALTSVTSTGGSTPGIDLMNTTGSFTVVGDNANTTRGGNGSGGTIAQKSGADGATPGLSNGVGVGVLLVNASNVSLNRMNLLGFNNWALHATSVSNFNLRYSTVGGMTGFNGGLNGTSVALDEGSVRINNLTGTSSFVGVDISDGLEDNVVIVNTGASVLTSFLVDNCSIHDVAPSPNGANGLLFDSEGASANITVQNSSFFNNLSASFLFVTNNNSASVNSVTVQTSNFQDAFNAVAIEPNFSSQTTFNVLNNPTMLRHTNVININLGTSSTGGSFLNGTVMGNTIGQMGVTNSGTTSTGTGIRGIWNGAGTGTVRIENNTIHEVYPNASGVILVQKTGGNSNLNATVKNNTALAGSDGANIGNGIRVITNSTSPETASMCLTMSGNTATGTTPDVSSSTTGDIFVRAQSNNTTINVFDGGFMGTPTQVLMMQNPATPDTTAATSGTGMVATQSSVCPLAKGTAQVARSKKVVDPEPANLAYLIGDSEMERIPLEWSRVSSGLAEPINLSLSLISTVSGAMSPSGQTTHYETGAQLKQTAFKRIATPSPERGSQTVTQGVSHQETEVRRINHEPRKDLRLKAPGPRPQTPDPSSDLRSRTRPQTSDLRPQPTDPRPKTQDPRPNITDQGQRSKDKSPKMYLSSTPDGTPVRILASPQSGETVMVGPFDLPPGESVQIMFQVTIDNPFPGVVDQVCNQATISGSNFSPVLTDDPSTGAANDATCTTVKVPRCTLTPAMSTNQIGGMHTVTVTLTELGTPVQGETVTFSVTAGPNMGQTGMGTTDVNGQATFTYTSNGTIGTDTIQASGDVGGALFSCTAGKTWVDVQCSLSPAMATNQVNTMHTVTVTLTENGSPLQGETVTFSVTAGPNTGQTGMGMTDMNGQATFTYTGGGMIGTDTIQASGTTMSGVPFSCTASKTWIDVACSLSPMTDTNQIGTMHTVTVTVMQGVNLIAGETVTFSVTAGPNMGQTGMGTTDMIGQATFSYTSNGMTGTDTIQASGMAMGSPFSCTASKTWVDNQCSLSPSSDTNQINTSHTVTVTLTQNGMPVNGVMVNFGVTGVNATSGSGTTNMSGQAQFSYTGTSIGADTITASGMTADGVPFSCTASKTWVNNQCSLSPSMDTNQINTSHTVTVTLTQNGNPVSGVMVNFTVTGVNPTSGSGTTNGSGQALFSYTGTNTGSDTITASGMTPDGVPFMCTAQKTWEDVQCSVSPSTDTNQVGTSHTATMTLTINGMAGLGETVNFNITAGPNMGQSGMGITNLSGQAQFTYTSNGTPGTDTIEASGTTMSGVPFSCTASKTWIDLQCSLTPTTDDNPVGTSHTVTVTVTVNGGPQAGVPVNFAVTAGPNAGTTGMGTTDMNGQAQFIYTDPMGMAGLGTDTIQASGMVMGVPFSCTASKTWSAPGCALSPAMDSNTVGTSHTVTATVTAGPTPLPGVAVNFSVTAGPNMGQSGMGTTDASGQTTFTYTGQTGPAGLGTDTIQASGSFNGINFSCTATKDWVNQPPVALCQNVTKTADNTCQATVTAAEVDNGSFDPDGGTVMLSLSPAGPYALGMTMVTLTVTDDEGFSTTCTATITVTNAAPQADAGPSQQVDEGQAVTLAGTAMDADPGQTLSVMWTQVGGPAVTLMNANTLMPTFMAPQVPVGTFVTLTFQLTVTDACGAMATDTVVVNVDDVLVVQVGGGGHCLRLFPSSGTFLWRLPDGTVIRGTVMISIEVNGLGQPVAINLQGVGENGEILQGGISLLRNTASVRLTTADGRTLLGSIVGANTGNNGSCP